MPDTTYRNSEAVLALTAIVVGNGNGHDITPRLRITMGSCNSAQCLIYITIFLDTIPPAYRDRVRVHCTCIAIGRGSSENFVYSHRQIRACIYRGSKIVNCYPCGSDIITTIIIH